MNILCTGNHQKNDFMLIYNNICRTINNIEHNVFMDSHVFKNKKIKGFIYDKIYKPKNSIDFVISLGGDGSILSAVSRMKDMQIPILGIHIGELGFLNQATKNNYLECINYIFKSNKIKFKKNYLLQTQIVQNEKTIYRLNALNDFAINQIRYSRLLKIDVEINKELLNRYNCDGLIVATPLGSTAYSLSAGGPIVSQNVNSIIITPVSPHSLSARPIVIGDKSNITIKFPNLKNKIGIYADGQIYKSLDANCIVKIFKSNIYSKLITFPKVDTYYHKLRNKLKWFVDHGN